MVAGGGTLVLQQTFAGRLNTRVQLTDDMWVFWHCNGRAEASRVGNVSLGGVFVETRTPPPLGSTAEVHFLVREGQIRTEGVVRHVEPGRGVGLRFTTIKDESRPRLISLMVRLRSLETTS